MGILEMDFERILGVTFFISSFHSIMLWSARAQKFEILEKKNYLWVSAFRDYDHNIKVDDYFFAGSYSSLRRS